MQQPTALLNQARGLLIQAVRREPVKLSISVLKGPATIPNISVTLVMFQLSWQLTECSKDRQKPLVRVPQRGR